MGSPKLFLLVAFIVLVGVTGALVLHEAALAPTSSVEKISSSSLAYLSDPENTIHIVSPVQGQKITSPLVVRGEARGQWFFEATFPVQLRDDRGTILGQDTARAEGEWMTGGFVPFSSTLVFPTSSLAGGEGRVVLKKDNPSGLPQNDKELIVPVRF